MVPKVVCGAVCIYRQWLRVLMGNVDYSCRWTSQVRKCYKDKVSGIQVGL